MRLTFLILFALFLCSVEVQGIPNGITCRVETFQYDTLSRSHIRLSVDTIDLYAGVRTSGFHRITILELETISIDSQQCTIDLSVLTAGASPWTHHRRYTVEYGLPIRITGIPVKANAEYRLDVTPLGAVSLDTIDCPFSGDSTMPLEIVPTAHLDFVFLEGSFASFFVNSVKVWLDDSYEKVRDPLGFTLPGKYRMVLSPCFTREILWDRAFGMSTNPLRTSGHALFSRDLIALDLFPILHTAFLRSWGYAPAPLVDGLSGIESFSLYDVRALEKSGRSISLDSLLWTPAYLRADPELADRFGASFALYLVRKHGHAVVRKLYQSVSDLTLPDAIAALEGTSLRVVEKKWRAWIDSAQITPAEYLDAITAAELSLNFKRMHTLSAELLKLATTASDSAHALSLNERASFFAGDYASAISAQRTLMALQPANSSHQAGLGGYLVMHGEYGTADSLLRALAATDSTSTSIPFNRVQILLSRGDTASADALLTKTRSAPATKSAELDIIHADLLRAMGRPKSDYLPLYRGAVDHFLRVLQTQIGSATAMAWLGRAYAGQDDFELAFQYLEAAAFIETRPFYFGLAHLWLGNLMDSRGDREIALAHYRAVTESGSAAYHKTSALGYIKSPYKAGGAK